MKKTLWGLLLLMLMALDLLAGDGISWPEGIVFFHLRLPRMLTALLAGAAMALSGTQMQALFRNPLADPHIMGVSSGAGFGAALAAKAVGSTSALAGSVSLIGGAFVGAIISGALIMAASMRVKSTGTLLLVGVMLGFIFSAFSSILQYTAGEESLKLFYSWMAGSFSGAGYGSLAWIGAAVAIGIVLSLTNLKALDLILFGDDFASFSGLSLKSLRISVMLGCALMTGAVTAFCGPIGFVGIAAPHIMRRSLGTSAHRTIIPWGMVAGACLTLAGDIAAHLPRTPLPVGSTLALLGIPIIIVLLWRNRL